MINDSINKEIIMCKVIDRPRLKVDRVSIALEKVEKARLAFYKGIRPIDRMFMLWSVYLCPKCKVDSMISCEESITGYRCVVEGCGNEDSPDIEIPCDVCDNFWPVSEIESWEDDCKSVCPNCVSLTESA